MIDLKFPIVACECVRFDERVGRAAYASGVAEVGLGGLLLVERTRRLAALAAAALFIAVFPGNVNMVRLWWDKPWPMRAIALARLPLQIPMITAALKVSRNS